MRFGTVLGMETEKTPRPARKKTATTPSSTVPDRGDAVSAGSKTSRPIRLQRALAAAGYGSRRQCEDLIVDGRVIIDGKVVTELGVTVDVQTQKAFVDGTPLKPRRLVYYALNKPVGVVTTNVDPEGRPRVIDLVPPDERVFPVGRLDRSSEGLILLTNDGELAQRLAHPKFEICKVYRCVVAGKVEVETLRQMERGIHIAEGLVRVEGARLLKIRGRATELEITLKEGKNREIRRILARLGHKVQQLKRIAIGSLRLGEMPSGAYRKLGFEELKKLKASIEPVRGRGADPDGELSTGPSKPRSSGKKGVGSRASAGKPRLSRTGESRTGDDAPPRKFAKRDKPMSGMRDKPDRFSAGDDTALRKGIKKGARPAGTGSRVSTTSRRPLPKKREPEIIIAEPKTSGSIIGADPAPPRTERLARKTLKNTRDDKVVDRKRSDAPKRGLPKSASRSGTRRDGAVAEGSLGGIKKSGGKRAGFKKTSSAKTSSAKGAPPRTGGSKGSGRAAPGGKRGNSSRGESGGGPGNGFRGKRKDG